MCPRLGDGRALRYARPIDGVRSPALAIGLALGLALSVVAPAQAQSRGEEEARALFARGVAAADAGTWDEAREAFEDAYRLWPRATILLNLAGARVQTGRLVSGADAYRALLATSADAPPAIREAAAQALAALEPRVPRLALRVSGLLDDDVVQIDGEDVGVGAESREHELDPGRHVVRALRAGEEVRREEFRLEEGERLQLDLRLPPPTADPELEPRPDPTPSPPEPDPSEDIAASPIFWAILGVAVAAAAGLAIGLSVGLGEEAPFMGNLMPGTVDVR